MESISDRVNYRREKIEDIREKHGVDSVSKEGFSNRNNDDKMKGGSNKKGVMPLVITIICLGLTTLIFGTLFVYNITVGYNDKLNTIEQNYYNLVDYVDNIEVNMSKLMVSNDTQEQQKMLVDISTQSNLAVNELSTLPLHDESKFYTTKYINQLADYTKYLITKLIDGGNLTSEDKEMISSLYQINSELKSGLNELNGKLGDNFDFNSIIKLDNNDVLKSFNELENNAVDYPKLIYDGPFSDGLESKSVKGLSGEEVDSIKAGEIFNNIFNYLGVECEVTGENKGEIDTFTVESNEVGVLQGQITKVGGKLLTFNYHKDCNVENYLLSDCLTIADNFLTGLGYQNMKAVWATESGATAYINYCYTIDNVIIYGDMVKVTVCKERGVVSSLDSREYYLNHTDRNITATGIGEQNAIDKVSENLTVESVRLALIPKGNDSEVLTYEVCGKFNGITYYVYINASSGKEEQIFRVVETTEGTLLI